MIENRFVVSLIEADSAALSYDASSTSALLGSFSFDISILEMFLPLLTGGTLNVFPESTRKDPGELHRQIDQMGLTHLLLSPVMLRNLPRERLPSLKVLCFGGDTLDEATTKWWAQQTRLVSLYGPTETTVQSSLGDISPGESTHIHSIGRPLPGYKMYLLNPYRQLVPAGVAGEICIAGGPARGYINREDLTQERFVLDPFDESPYNLIYLSGDLGRYRDDGTIEFLGRNDAQIKVRGFRIELGEIENLLYQFPGIDQVVCAAKGEGDNRCGRLLCGPSGIERDGFATRSTTPAS